MFTCNINFFICYFDIFIDFIFETIYIIFIMRIEIRDYQSLGRRIMTMLFGLGLPLYLLFHLFTGERSWSALLHRGDELKQKTQYIDELTENNRIISKKLQLLQNSHVDQDLLEELARKNLGLIYPNEIILKEKE